MPLISSSIPNLINGVSQQPPALRLASQAEQVINCMPSPVEGLKKRPPMYHLAKLFSGSAGTNRPFVHLVERDGSIQYIIIIQDQNIKVCDLQGNIATVSTPDGLTYLDVDGKPSEQFRVASLADYTFITNREQKVAMATTTSPAHMQGGGTAAATQAMVFIKGANYDTDYSVTLNGTTKTYRTYPAGGKEIPATYSQADNSTNITVTAVNHPVVSGDEIDISFISSPSAAAGTYTVSGVTSTTITLQDVPTNGSGSPYVGNCVITAKQELSTIDIADKLASKLDKNTPGGVSGFTVTNDDYIIKIVKDDGSPFTLSSKDSKTGEDTKTIQSTVDDLNDLPVKGYQGFIVKLQGSRATLYDDYYVKFTLNKTSPSVGEYGDGVWKETVAPGIAFEFDATTMPHVLVRETNGTYTFKKHTWSGRLAGDTLTAPNPTFVDDYIQNINLFRNRLVFLSNENVILSAADAQDRFWPETVQTIIDSDPVDLATGGTSINLLTSSISFANTLLLFSRHSQFRLDAGLNVGSTLTPKTATITQITSYDMVESVDPIAVGRNTYFATPKGNFSGLREFFLPDSSGSVPLSEDVTSSIPRFIDDNLCTLVSAVAEESIVMISADEPKRIYIYKFFFEEDTKLQSAWSYWEIKGDNRKIIGGAVQGSDLYVVIEYSDGVYLEKVSLRPEQIDAGTEIEILLDRKTTEPVTVGTYSQSGTTVTVTSTNHGYSVNDSIYIALTSGDGISGTYTIATVSTDGNTFTYTAGTSLSVSGNCSFTKYLTLNNEGALGVETVITLPYPAELNDDVVVVGRFEEGNTIIRHGQVIEGTIKNDSGVIKLTVPGDLRTVEGGKIPRFFIGNRYEMTYEFSTPYIKEQPQGGGVALAAGPKLQMRTWTVIFDESSAFELKVTPASRDTNTYPYNGIVVGEAPPLVGDPSDLTGSFRVPVMASNIDTKIVISSTSPLPCRFQSAEWEGFYHTRAKRQ